MIVKPQEVVLCERDARKSSGACFTGSVQKSTLPVVRATACLPAVKM